MGSKLYTRGERIFKWVSLVLLLVICVATLAPFVLILASSLTDETTLITYGYSFWPQKFSMDSYLYMWNQRKQIGRSYLTSLGITAVGTVVSLLFTTMLAYPMSRKDFKYSNQLSFFVFFIHAVQWRYCFQLHYVDPDFSHQEHLLCPAAAQPADERHEHHAGTQLLQKQHPL